MVSSTSEMDCIGTDFGRLSCGDGVPNYFEYIICGFTNPCAALRIMVVDDNVCSVRFNKAVIARRACRNYPVAGPFLTSRSAKNSLVMWILDINRQFGKLNPPESGGSASAIDQHRPFLGLLLSDLR